MTKRESLMVRVIAAFVLLLLAAAEARADSSEEAVGKVTQLNKEAVTAYQAKKYDDARKILKQALDLAESSGLEQHPITARTHIHMGIVIIVGFKQRDLGIKQFKKAIEIEPTINLTKALVTPELSDAFAEAKGAGGGTGAAPAATPPPTEAEPPESAPAPPAAAPSAQGGGEAAANGLVHEPVTEAKKGSAISITVGVSADLKFDKMVLAYRPEGSNEFLGREMKEVAEGRYGAEIPTTATGGASVAYYVEADDTEGNAVASRGSVDSPLVIDLGGSRAAARHKSSDEEEEEDEGPAHRYFVAALLGTGFGWATGDGDTNHDTMISPAGFALAKLGQFAPEAGYWLNSSLMLSLQLRYQHVSGTTDPFVNGRDYHTANYAFAAFAKATWRWGEDKLHPFFSLAAGGGQIRHVVTLNQLKNTCGSAMNEACVDTIAAGPILLGPGGGLFYDLTDSLSLIVQANSVIGFPTFTFNVDINVGVGYGF
jgi:hypothetical protein